MKFEIEATFVGFCGSKAVLNQGEKARMFSYYSDIAKLLRKKIHIQIIAECQLDSDGTIWIKNIRNQEA